MEINYDAIKADVARYLKRRLRDFSGRLLGAFFGECEGGSEECFRLPREIFIQGGGRYRASVPRVVYTKGGHFLVGIEYVAAEAVEEINQGGVPENWQRISRDYLAARGFPIAGAED